MQIVFSALGPSVSQQMEAGGAKLKNAELIDRLEHAVTMLHVHSCLTNAETDRARRRILKLMRAVPRKA